MSQLQVIEHENLRVLMTAQLAEAFDTTTQIITNNFNRNKDRYIEGKHFKALRGEEKKQLLRENQIDFSNKDHTALYLWTERGAWLHAKSLNTDKAWEAYGMLVDEYYRLKEQTMVIPRTLPEALRLAADLAEKNETLTLQNTQKERIIQEYEPKVNYCERILQSKNAVNVTQIAKDYGLTAQRLNLILNEEKVQYKVGGQWVLHRRHHGKGYTESETLAVARGEEVPIAVMNTRWTQKGRLFIHEVLQERGIYALVDRLQEEPAS